MEPSPMKAVVKKVIGSLICAFVYMKFVTVYPIDALKGKINEFFCTQQEGRPFTVCMFQQTRNSQRVHHLCTKCGS